jgi:3-oxoacyl-[acyl-carrier protein] reductase
MKGADMDAREFLQFPDDVTVVVTGAGSGIGATVSTMLGELGIAVSAWDLNLEAAQRTVDEIVAGGGTAHAFRADVTDEAAVATAFAESNSVLPPAHYLINNAGPSSFSEMTFREALGVAIGSVDVVTKAWLETDASHGGALVNVSSVAGALTGAGANDWYASSKAGIAGYTRYLALHRPNGIRANAVAPGTIDTPRTAGMLETDYGKQVLARNPMGRIGLPADVAWAMVVLLSPRSEYLNGVLLPVDGGSLLVY